MLKVGLSTRQDSCTVQIVRLPGPDTIKSNYNKDFGFRVHTFAFLWVLNSWTDISTATPDLGPEKITETRLDRISLVSHPGVDMAGLFFTKKVGDTMRMTGILMALAISFASP